MSQREKEICAKEDLIHSKVEKELQITNHFFLPTYRIIVYMMKTEIIVYIFSINLN